MLQVWSHLAPEPRISRPGYMGRSWWTRRDDARNNNAWMHGGTVRASALRWPRNATLQKSDRRPERAAAQNDQSAARPRPNLSVRLTVRHSGCAEISSRGSACSPEQVPREETFPLHASTDMVSKHSLLYPLNGSSRASIHSQQWASRDRRGPEDSRRGSAGVGRPGAGLVALRGSLAKCNCQTT